MKQTWQRILAHQGIIKKLRLCVFAMKNFKHMKIFISNLNEGWREMAIPKNFQRYSHDALVTVLHQFMDTSKYKGILITENPEPGVRQRN